MACHDLAYASIVLVLRLLNIYACVWRFVIWLQFANSRSTVAGDLCHPWRTAESSAKV